MNKVIGILIALVLVSSAALAGVNPPPTTAEGKTAFGNLSVQGYATEGNAGYIEMKAASSSATNVQWYLWVKSDGDLCIASSGVLTANASFPNGNWKTSIEASCTVVGGQS